MNNRLVFIVGMARTGTTLMARSLSKGSRIYFLNETHFMREYQPYFSSDSLCESDKFTTKFINQFITIQRKDYYRKSEYQEYPDAVQKVNEQFNGEKTKNFAALLRCLFSYETKLKGKERAGDQTPNHIFFIDHILKWFPDALFINMVRDPRAVVLSQKNKWKASRRLKQPRFEIIRARINYHPITQSVLWLRAVNAGFSAHKSHGGKTIQTVFYERLVSAPEKTLQKVCKFIAIDYDQKMLNVPVAMSSNVSSSSVEGMDSSLVDKWQALLSSTEVFLIELICGRKAHELDYKLTHVKPNYFMLVLYLLIFPFHILLAYLFSAGRFKNIFNSFKRLFR